MVSFSCEVCNDTVIKKKLPQHQRSCHGAYFTCIDCNTTFYNNDHTKHTSCITEAEKYEKGLYKGKKSKQPKQIQPVKQAKQDSKPVQKIQPKAASKAESKEEPKKKSKKESSKEEFNISKYITNEPTPLYKIFKDVRKENKKLADKTDFLKNVKITQNDDGSFKLFI